MPSTKRKISQAASRLRESFARVHQMHAERERLAEFHADIGRVWRGIGDRVAFLDRLIEAEKVAEEIQKD